MSRWSRLALLTICFFSVPSSWANLDTWRIDYDNSKVSFFAEQAGAEFEGYWRNWDAEVRFDPEHLEASAARAEFNIDSVHTGDSERDETLRDAEWFDGNAHPLATFEATEFSALQDGSFEADSILTVKGLAAPVSFRFQLQQKAKRIVLNGEATIDRLAAGLGLGEWADTSWIGQFVRVKVEMHAHVGER
ncbi:MAG: YceI family protein [Gammaproteobacteria bacterium]|nr:YceI family protein [Gammaproteobacteria bacterium]